MWVGKIKLHEHDHNQKNFVARLRYHWLVRNQSNIFVKELGVRDFWPGAEAGNYDSITSIAPWSFKTMLLWRPLFYPGSTNVISLVATSKTNKTDDLNVRQCISLILARAIFIFSRVMHFFLPQNAHLVLISHRTFLAQFYDVCCFITDICDKYSMIKEFTIVKSIPPIAINGDETTRTWPIACQISKWERLWSNVIKIHQSADAGLCMRTQAPIMYTE